LNADTDIQCIVLHTGSYFCIKQVFWPALCSRFKTRLVMENSYIFAVHKVP